MSSTPTMEGRIVQCIGAVIDIQFPRDSMPKVYDALTLVEEADSFAEKDLTFEVEQLLPLPADRLTKDERAARQNWDYLYEPEAKVVLDQLLTRYVEQIIYQAVAENMASEQSARMVAMKAASDNASSVIDDLTLVYNKTRQAAITKELSEIVGGAAAV